MRVSYVLALLVACLAVTSAVRLQKHVRQGATHTVKSVPTSQKKSSAIPWFLRGNKLNQVFERYRASRVALGTPVAPVQWFEQIQDHFDWQNNATWKQRYYTNADNYKTGGPIFLTFGGEGPLTGDYVYGTMVAEYAAAMGAMVYGVEHRYYGQSSPVPDYTVPNMRFLSSEQALADLAHFREQMTEQNKLTGPWIVFGGSYSGALSAWFRIKYPQLAIGAIATSAPVRAKIDFSEYLQVVDASLKTMGGGTACTAPIGEAIQKIESMIATADGQQELQQMFNLCEPLSSALDQQTFMSTVVGSFMGVVQYNDERAGTPDILNLCGIMKSSSDALANIVNVTKLINSPDDSCINTSWKDMITELSNTTAGETQASRCWIYQTCQEFAFFQTTDAPNLPFGNGMPLNYSFEMCKEVFGIDRQPLVNETNNIYGSDDPAGENIVFPNGSIDPWHALSIQENLPNNQTLLFINGTAHCANMIPPQSQDPPSLNQARQQIQATLQQWVADFHAEQRKQ